MTLLEIDLVSDRFGNLKFTSAVVSLTTVMGMAGAVVSPLITFGEQSEAVIISLELCLCSAQNSVTSPVYISIVVAYKCSYCIAPKDS